MNPHSVNRRGFLTTLSTGAAAAGFSLLAPSLQAAAKHSATHNAPGDPDAWFEKISGKHRIVFDADWPRSILTFAWPRVYLMTNSATGTPASDCGVVLVLRHEAIPYALNSDLWKKYTLGEVFKINDPLTNTPATRNPFWQPKSGDYKVPGIGNVAIGINELQDSGVMICVCDVAMTINSAGIASKMNMEPEAVKNEWVSGLLPDIQIVPSGVWAVGRAQEHGCTYCYAG